MSLLAVSDGLIIVAKENCIDCYDYSNHEFLQFKSESLSQEDEVIVDIVISPDKKLLGVLLSTSKKLMIYELPYLKHVESFTLPRSASKIRFDCYSKRLLVADKTGDVLIFETSIGDKGTKVLGHLSMLLNVLQTNDGKYIISSDRDEKIKVSCYPNAYNIQTYCLGHKEFVKHIEILPHDTKYLTSASGDGTVKVWNYISGKLLYNLDTYIDIKNNDDLKQLFSKLMDEEGIEINSLPIVDYTISQLTESSSLIALTIHSYKKILVYNLNFANEQFSHSLVSELPMEYFPASIKFHNLLLYVYDNVNLKILQYKIITTNDNISITFDRHFKVFENQEVKTSVTFDNNSIKLLFKRKFDNVQEYKERKKLRLKKPL